MDAVQPGQRLHGIQPGEDLVHVHRVQQRLVEAGLELLGDDQHLVVVVAESLGGLGFGEPVHPLLGVASARLSSITVPENATSAARSV